MIGKHIYLFDAVSLAAKSVWEIRAGTVALLLNILPRHGGMEGLAGPVGIAALAGQAAGQGLLSLAYFTGVLSMSLGTMNLFPLPALDGGQLVMLLVEAIRRKPVSLKTHQAFNLIGFALCIILSVLITYKDMVNLFA